MPVLAQVALPDLPLDLLTYEVPAALRDSLQVGMRVSVPLGKRILAGFCTELHSVDALPAKTRALLEVLDPEPVLTAAQLTLAQWTASYYCTSLGDALKACLPQGMMQKPVKRVSLCSSDQEAIARAGARSRLRRAVLDQLVTGEEMTEDELCVRLGVRELNSTLHALEELGLVRVTLALDPPKAHARTVKALRLLPPWTESEHMHDLMVELEKRAPKQADLVTILWQARRDGETTLPMTEALRAANATHAQVSALVEKDVLVVEDMEWVRRPSLRFAEHLEEPELNEDQRSAAEAIRGALDTKSFSPFLLHGVTASGKTLLYLHAVRETLARGRTALVLVPEIALTPQLQYRFTQAFGADVVVVHSRLSLGERHDAWKLIRDGKARVVLGVRSAVFSPLDGIGLIVVDEEHEPSYKQSDLSPRYHARDVAVVRARFEQATILLGSATPSAESLENTRRGKYTLLSLPRRMDGARLPDMVLIDVGEEKKRTSFHGSITPRLLAEVRQRQERDEGIILFQNRRGYAPSLECEECGHVETCDNCSISLTFHKDRDQLRCHYCGDGRRLPPHCPQCGSSALLLVGSGTQRLEEELGESLTEARVIRMDADSTRKKGAHDIMLTTFGEGEADVLLGTQMVAKGLDFHRVTLVGVISADQSLLFPDFRATERTFQLLTQVAGRAGRGERPGTVFIQTHRPFHPVYAHLLAHDYEGFMEKELDQRRHLRYPPYSRLVLLTLSDPDENQVLSFSRLLFSALSTRLSGAILHPPQPALLKRLKRVWRYQILIRIDKARDPDNSRFRTALTEVLSDPELRRHQRRVHLLVDVDPHDTM